MKIKGLNELEKQMKQMQKGSKELKGTDSIPFDDLFTSSFMKQNTPFNSFDELLTSGGFVVNSEEDFEAIPDEEFDAFISSTTEFDSWSDMLGTATEEYVSKKLGF